MVIVKTIKTPGIRSTVQPPRIRAVIQKPSIQTVITYLEPPTVPIYRAQYQAWLDRATFLGHALPTDPEKLAQNAFIGELVDSGLFARLKYGHLFGFGSAGFQYIDIASALKVSVVVNGAVLNSQGNGVKSDGYGLLAYDFDTTNYPGIHLNSTVVTYVSEHDTNQSTEACYWCYDSGYIVWLQPMRDGSINQFHFTGGGASNIPNTTHKGLYVSTHDGVTTIILYKDGVKTTASPLVLFAIQAPFYLLYGGFGAFYQHYIAAHFIFDKFSDADETAFRTYFNNYKAAIGLP